MQVSGSADLTQQLVEFVHKWGLDVRSQQLLEGLPANVQEAVFAGFDPPAGTRSADAKLNAFVRMMGSGGGGGGQWADASAAGGGGSAAGIDQVVAQFVLQWGIDEVSEQLLRGQTPDYIREVTQSFNPPADTRNVSARFCTFLRGGSGFRQPGTSLGNGSQLQVPRLSPGPASGVDQAAVEQFVATWGLDDNCRQILLTLSHEALQGVIADFNPPGDTQNVNARFMTFVRSRDKGGGGGGGGATLVVPRLTLGGGGVKRQAVESLKSFVAKWGLDAQSEGMLRQLQPAQLVSVLTDFQPPAGTRNVNGRLNAFVKSVLKSSPGGGASADPAEAFAVTWGLDDDAYQVLNALPAGTKEAVMREFNPPPGTLNASGKLKAFIRHRAASGGEGGGDGGRGGELGGDGSRKRSWPTFSTGEVATFVEKWRLDESAEHTLMSLPEDVLADVIKEFNPPPGTWNPSGRLHSFVKARMEKSARMDGMAQEGATNPYTVGDSYSALAIAGGSHDEATLLTVRAFIEKWGLDNKSEEMLLNLSQELLATVVASFEPDAATRNRNAKLASWVRFLQQSQSGGDLKRARY